MFGAPPACRASPRPRHGPGRAVTELSGFRICVVDPDEATLVALRELLRSDGFVDVIATPDAGELLLLVDRHEVDLVIVDPAADGREVDLVRELDRRRGPSVYLPILVLTEEASAGVRRKALATGAADFVAKPFDPSEVLLRIRNLLATRALHVELDGHRRLLEQQLMEHQRQAREEWELRAEQRARVLQAMEPGSIRLVYQPVFGLDDGRLLGAESLTRFEVEPHRPPNEWFAEAELVGLGADLELASVREAAAQMGELPRGAFLSVNLSAEVAASPRLADALAGADLSCVVVELTEHAPVTDYAALRANLEGLRAQGVRIAIDDAGAGYASFQHILRLQPDLIKLDLGLTAGIDQDPVRRALATALLTFGREIGALMIAEGVERQEELDALIELGFAGAQGYFLGRPEPLPIRTTMLDR